MLSRQSIAGLPVPGRRVEPILLADEVTNSLSIRQQVGQRYLANVGVGTPLAIVED
jgi:hypothetical protein